MRLIRQVEGKYSNATLETAWLVESGGEHRTIRWLPAGRCEIRIRRLVRVSGALTEASQCGLG
jgi:hypothetical protein